MYPTIPLNSRTSIAVGVFDGLIPTLIDCVLLLRLYAVYPYDGTPRVKFTVILGVAVLLKIGRIINAAFFLRNYARTIRATPSISSTATILVTARLPSIKIEWSLQIVVEVYEDSQRFL